MELAELLELDTDYDTESDNTRAAQPSATAMVNITI